MNKKLLSFALTLAFLLASLTPYNVQAGGFTSAHSCGVGYVHKGKKCVKIEITGNEYLSRLAHCATNHGQTVKSFNACMKSHRGNNQK